MPCYCAMEARQCHEACTNSEAGEVAENGTGWKSNGARGKLMENKELGHDAAPKLPFPWMNVPFFCAHCCLCWTSASLADYHAGLTSDSASPPVGRVAPSSSRLPWWISDGNGPKQPIVCFDGSFSGSRSGEPSLQNVGSRSNVLSADGLVSLRWEGRGNSDWIASTKRLWRRESKPTQHAIGGLQRRNTFPHRMEATPPPHREKGDSA